MTSGRDLARSTARRAERLARRALGTTQDRRVAAWRAAGGDTTLRFRYPLDERSVVVDVGGHDGQWASDVVGRFLATVHVVEPVPHLAAGLRERFARNPRVVVHEVALADRDGTGDITVDDVRSSRHVSGSQHAEIRLVDGATFLAALPRVDLLKVNIEGDEYPLLDHLLAAGALGRVQHLQVQFHDFVPGADERMRSIQDRLAATHALDWRYEYVWESWTLQAR